MNLKNTPNQPDGLGPVILGMPLTLLGQKEITKTFSGIKKIQVGTASGSCVIKKSEIRPLSLTKIHLR